MPTLIGIVKWSVGFGLRAADIKTINTHGIYPTTQHNAAGPGAAVGGATAPGGEGREPGKELRYQIGPKAAPG